MGHGSATRIGGLVGVVVPIKSFARAKARLAAVLTPDERQRLAQLMAERVLSAARGLQTFVVCEDPDVRRWATDHGADVLWSPGLGLNGALERAKHTLAQRGIDHIVIAHGDLPLVSPLYELAVRGSVTIIPDRHRDGTNVLALPTDLTLRLRYGPGSFAAHLDAALRCGLPVRVCDHPALRLDVDTPDDIADPRIRAALGMLA